MLDPDSRSLYSSILAPPPGMIFDEAIAATFSMDPVLLLEAPLHLALMMDASMSDPPLSILQSVRRYSERITAYVQKGRIRVPRATRPNPLFGLLEEMIVEVNSPSGGVFHPKVWAIRFSGSNGQDSMIRLVILTRNMTTNPSWDLSIKLEGEIGPREEKVNKPLAHFFRNLPEFALNGVSPTRRKQAIKFSEEIHNVSWKLPDGFDELSFYIPGTEGFDWEPPESNRMAIISPFCSDEVLRTFAEKTASAVALISTPEQMADLKKDTLDRFSRCWHLDEAAETEEGEEDEKNGRVSSTGLHAKAYLFETDRGHTHLVTGSANATNAALNAALRDSRNIEILVGLKGEKKKVGGIDELLHEDNMGKYLVQFEYDGQVSTDTDSDVQKAEECIERARLKLAEAQLSLKCSRASGDDLWTLTLVGNIPFLDGIRTATAWPITVMEGSGTSILGNNSGKIDLGKFSTSSVTGLVAFELRSRHHSHFSVSFVMNLPVEGMPADERNSTILETVIKNQDGFMKYLLLLLGDAATNGSATPDLGTESRKWISRLSRGEEFPLLEEMVRAYSRYPDRLSEISSLIRDLSSRGDANQFVPEKFLELWKVFESALGERNARQ